MAVIKCRRKDGTVVPIRVIKGNDGNQMFVRFSAYADGTDMSEKWDAECNFMGIAFAYETPIEKEQYQWISLADISLGHYAEEGSEDKYLFFVGNGTGEDNRSNALTLDAEGVMWILKDLLIGEERTSVLDEFNAVKKRATTLEKWKDDAERDAKWNVESNVGAISSATNMEELKFNIDTAPTASMSIPMINSGALYLDFCAIIKLVHSKDSNCYDASYSLGGNIEIYVNNVLSETYSAIYAPEAKDFLENGSLTSIEKAISFRHLLNVNRGDVVTLKVLSSMDAVTTYKRKDDYGYLTIKDIQLKANIITAHTYVTLGDELEGPTAEEIINTMLGEE